MDKCTGCGACIQRCPQNCIRWEKGEFGFRYPIVDKEQCINCGLCQRTCPIGKDLKQPINQKVFAAIHKDKGILMNSTSGGAFSAIAQYVLERNGSVYGCHMDSDMKAIHIRIDKKEELGKVRGSKYIQSDIKDTYFTAENELKNGKWVLYTGTPCQITGLYGYLGKEYGRLVTMDIVCHGVGSQAYFDKYMEYVWGHYGNIKELHFRSKKYAGWSCSGVVVIDNKYHNKIKKFNSYNNYYYSYFLKGDIYRKSCYECQYANTVRQGDFTAGDFWGVESYDLEIDIKNGCSLLFVNNSKAQRILDSITELQTAEVTLWQAVRDNGQLNKPSDKSSVREELAEQYEKLDAGNIQKLFIKNNKRSVAKGFVKSLVPYRVKLKIRKCKNRFSALRNLLYK